MANLICLCLCLLPLAVLGGLLGGYRPVKLGDPVVKSRIEPALKGDHRLSFLPITEVQQQRLYRVTNYKVYQDIPNKTGVRMCVRITCYDNEGCRNPEPCSSASRPEGGVRRPEGSMEPVRRPHLLGGLEPADQHTVQGAVDVAVEKLNGMSNAMYRMVPEGVTNITKQVVSGMKYKFTLSLVTSQCRNSPANKGKQLQDCQLADSPQVQKCDVTVWHKLDGEYSVENLQCGKMQAYDQQPMLGGDGHDSCHNHLKAFEKFKEDFGRLYGSPKEEGERFQAFCRNMQKIRHLQKMEQGSAVYGVNKFADLTEEEFRKQYLSPRWDVDTPRPWMTPAAPVDLQGGVAPDQFDWRQHGKVTPVKNQGSCGSCWAFSTTGNIEGQWAIKSNRLVSLSEQELVDCDKLDDGCEGGLPSNAYQAIMKLGGLETESEYSYRGMDEKCHFNRTEVAVKISGGLNISSNEEEMKAWLYKNGPISIGINAFAMQFYFGGISHPWKIFCNPDKLDHGVLIVGYGVTNKNEPYWIVKNSWGADWGEKGYYLVYRGGGVCGLNRMCTSAVIN